jgi:hypothetical protein
MDQTLKTGGLLPSAMALKASLNQKPGTSQEPAMLTSYQRELLLQFEQEIDDTLTDSPRLDALMKRLGRRGTALENVSLPKRA